MSKYALITGASRGIGREIAIQLAQKGYHLLLTARSATELTELADFTKKSYGINVACFAADLSEDEAPAKITAWCANQTSSLSVLINNAGYGLWGPFENISIKDQLSMIRVNINAVIELTHHLLPQLRQQDKAYILNVSSTAAYQAMPTLSIYAASKSFVLSYSRALKYELKDTHISVSCLCPGPTATGFASRAGLDAFADLADKVNMSAVDVARIGLRGMFNKKAEIIPGFLNKISVLGASHLPKAFIEYISAGLYKTS